ncbi:MAG: cation:proton antiporter [Candidatus Riflebacteria bacterium]|nr:cation:proton antiporter [Candidatus Riflebacteria bacterium]
MARAGGLAASASLVAPALAWAGGAQAPDPLAPVLLALAVVLVVAKVGGDLAARAGQPPVLGELVGGILVGNLALVGIGWFTPMRSDAAVDILARLGVVLLLFEVGLESTIKDMLKVGLSSFLVATTGVLVPFILGWGVGWWILPGASPLVHAFLGATLTATSVGITARVLRDLGRSQSAEARVILGAAVIDDVMGLIILAVVTGVIQAADRGSSLSSLELALVLLKASLFLVGALVLGAWLSPRLFSLTARLRVGDVLLATALSFCFLLSYLAAAVGLAPIVGAFAAGLILESVHYRDFTDRGEHELEELVRPITAMLAPVFFVLMGMQVDLRAFARPDVLLLGTLLTGAAILGKQACSLAAVGPGLDRLSIGIGMVPRGEVGLIFANIGLGLTLNGQRVIDEGVFSALVIMVVVTTLLTPPALRWSLSRGRQVQEPIPAAGPDRPRTD